jgi:hypothetical protein
MIKLLTNHSEWVKIMEYWAYAFTIKPKTL